MLNNIKNFCRENKILSIMLPITFLLILATGIIFKQELLAILPLFVSLGVMVLQARVNRYAWLVGSLNSLLYCYYYFSMGLMSNFLYALIISFPLQMITFFNWRKKTTDKVTRLKKMSPRQRILAISAFLLAWWGIFFGISFFPNASYSILDTLTSVLGIAVTILTALRFSEYVFLQLVSGAINIVMYVAIIWDGELESITYLIYAIYCLVCIVLAAVRMYNSKHGIIQQ